MNQRHPQSRHTPQSPHRGSKKTTGRSKGGVECVERKTQASINTVREPILYRCLRVVHMSGSHCERLPPPHSAHARQQRSFFHPLISAELAAQPQRIPALPQCRSATETSAVRWLTVRWRLRSLSWCASAALRRLADLRKLHDPLRLRGAR